MKVRERIQRRSEFKSNRFVVYDPEIGNVNANVSDFMGVSVEDGKTVIIRDDHPAINLEVVKEEA